MGQSKLYTTPEERVLAACRYRATYHERFVLGLLNFLALKFTLLYLRNRASVNQKLVAKHKLIKSAQLQFVILGLSTCLTLIRCNRVTRQLVQLMGEPSASAVLSRRYVINYRSIDLWLIAPQALAGQGRNMLMPLSGTVSTTSYGCTLINNCHTGQLLRMTQNPGSRKHWKISLENPLDSGWTVFASP